MATEDTLYVGDLQGANDVRTIDPTEADLAIQAAIDDLEAAGGGRLTITPSSSAYVLTAPLTVQASNVSIELQAGAILRPAVSGDTNYAGDIDYLIHVEDSSGPPSTLQQNFRLWGGGRIADSIGNANRSLVRITDSGDADATSLVMIEGIIFDVAAVDEGEGPMSCIFHNGASQVDATRTRGLYVSNCTFHGTENTTVGGYGEQGVRGIRAQRVNHVQVLNNRFISKSQNNAPAYWDSCIYLEDCPYSTVTGNLFRWVAGHSAIRLTTATTEEAGHSLIGDSVSESGELEYFLHLNGDFVVIRGNNIGNHRNQKARFRITEHPGGVPSRHVHIQGNSGHSATLSGDETGRYFVHADNCLGLFVEGNSYYNMHSEGIFVLAKRDVTSPYLANNKIWGAEGVDWSEFQQYQTDEDLRRFILTALP